MRVFLWSLLALCIVANQSDAKDVVGLRHRLQDETEAPTTVEDLDPTLGAGAEDETPAGAVDETPAPTEEESPTSTPAVATEGSPVPTPVTPGDDQTTAAPTPAGDETTEPPAEDVITPSPTPLVETSMPVPTYYSKPTYNTVPTNAAPASTYKPPIYTPPVDPPVTPYVTTDDDPLKPTADFNDDEEWQWKDSSVEQLEHDRTVIIALSVVFSLGLLLAIVTANQMLDNPDGLCASICRILVACTFAIFRLVCFPCRMLCGCTGDRGGRNTHDMVGAEHSSYTHDLELS